MDSNISNWILGQFLQSCSKGGDSAVVFKNWITFSMCSAFIVGMLNKANIIETESNVKKVYMQMSLDFTVFSHCPPFPLVAQNC